MPYDNKRISNQTARKHQKQIAMIIKCEMELWKFKAWSGGKAVKNRLTIEECKQLESILEEIYPDGMDEIELNDLLWFNTEWVLEELKLNEDDFWKREIKPF